MNDRNYLSQGERSAFDEGVRQGADFLAIIRWANYDEKTALYITAPYRTRDLVTAVKASEEAAVENIYDLHLDRDYQLHSPWQQWNTETGPHEPGRAMIEDYHRQFPDQGPLTDAEQARLPGHTPRPHGPAVRPADPVNLLHASARQIDQRERTPYTTPEPQELSGRPAETGRDLIRRAFDAGVARKADYMLLATDTAGGELFPAYVTAPDTTAGAINQLDSGTTVKEIYHLHSDRGAQINSSRPVWHNEAWAARQSQPLPQPGVDPELAAVRRMLTESFPETAASPNRQRLEDSMAALLKTATRNGPAHHQPSYQSSVPMVSTHHQQGGLGR